MQTVFEAPSAVSVVNGQELQLAHGCCVQFQGQQLTTGSKSWRQLKQYRDSPEKNFLSTTGWVVFKSRFQHNFSRVYQSLSAWSQEAVGAEVAIWWNNEQQWFEGELLGFNESLEEIVVRFGNYLNL